MTSLLPSRNLVSNQRSNSNPHNTYKLNFPNWNYNFYFSGVEKYNGIRWGTMNEDAEETLKNLT